MSNQQSKVVLPGQVWQHYRGNEVLVHAIEYSRNSISEGAIVEMRRLDVHIAEEIPENSTLVLYSHENKYWARTMHDFLEILEGNVNRFELAHDPRSRRKQRQAGFTLIELLVVIVVIGILAALSFRSFIGVTAKARQSEGVSNVGALNSAQAAYYLENNEFAADLPTLASGIPATTNNYQFTSVGTNAGVNSRAVSQALLPNGSSLRGYAGVVQLSAGANGSVQSLSIICSSQPGVAAIAPAAGTDFNLPTACGAGQEKQ